MAGSTGTVKTDAPAIADKEFTFTLSGSGFEVKTVQVNIQGTAAGAKAVTLTTAKLTPSAASIRGTAKLAAGEYKITVQNGAGGAASNALTFTVKAATAGAPTKPAGTTPKPKGK